MQQVVVNILISSALYALVGVGFMLIFRVAGFFHFAHGIVFAAAAYCMLVFKEWTGVPLVISAALAVAGGSVLGGVMELSIYRPLRRRGSSSLVLLLASLGVYVVLQNLISMLFGDHTRTVRSGIVEEGASILGARVTPVQILIIATSALLIVVAGILLKKTKLGKAMRALASDQELAAVSGVDSDRIFLWTLSLGSALAGVAGVLVALDVGMTPNMGMRALMMGIVVVVIGGIGSIPGIALGALFLGTAQHLGVWWMGSQWQDAIAFVILLAFLVVRPEGFLGKKARKATV